MQILRHFTLLQPAQTKTSLPTRPPTPQPRSESGSCNLKLESQVQIQNSQILKTLRHTTHPPSLSLLAPSHTVRSFECTPLPITTTTSLLQIAASLGHVLALGICAAQERTEPGRRAIQGLQIGFIHLGREAKEPVYLEHVLEGSRAWGLGIYDFLTQRFLLSGREILPGQEVTWLERNKVGTTEVQSPDQDFTLSRSEDTTKFEDAPRVVVASSYCCLSLGYITVLSVSLAIPSHV